MVGPAPASLTFVLAAALTTGCLLGPPSATPASAPDSIPVPPVVVALLDSGLNPYHLAFRAEPGKGVERFADGWNATVVDLAAEGDYGSRVRADQTFWDGAEEGRLYAFAGTRVMGISLGHDPDESILRDHAGSLGHGTATSSLVARDAPDAYIVLVQVDGTACDATRLSEKCPVYPVASQGMRWAADQPWIDVISVSLGSVGNAPSLATASPEPAAYVEASRLAHDRGKTIVAGTGNSVLPPAASHYAGVPWVIAAGGAEPAQRGEAGLASRGADVAANNTEWVATFDSVDGYSARSGTSYASPIVAATLAEALHGIRAARAFPGATESADPVATAAQVRLAMNASARLFDAAAWDPTQPTSNDTLTALFTPSIPVTAAGPQMGWGYVHAGLAGEIAGRVLADDLAVPSAKGAVAPYMERWQSLREAAWTFPRERFG